VESAKNSRNCFKLSIHSEIDFYFDMLRCLDSIQWLKDKRGSFLYVSAKQLADTRASGRCPENSEIVQFRCYQNFTTNFVEKKFVGNLVKKKYL